MRKPIVLLVYCCIGWTTLAQAQQKIFGHREDNWQYIYPFSDKSYGLAIEHLPAEGNNSINIYFGQKKGKTDVVFWKENHSATQSRREFDYVDYNNDGVKDLLMFAESGARGGNSYYLLYLVDPKKHTLTKVKKFDEIANPQYNRKHNAIVGYGMAGESYYSIYRINKKNEAYQIGESFEDREELDVDLKIKKLLKKYP